MDCGHKMIEKNNPKLHKTFWFWCALLTPTLIALDLALVMTFHNPEIQELFNFTQINSLINELKFPIAIASLSIPLVAIVVAIHRSSQTAHQIYVQTEQNNFANHFKHLEEFTKTIGSNTPLPWKGPEEFHSFIYPDTLLGSIKPKAIESLIDSETIIGDYVRQCKATPLEIPNLSIITYHNLLIRLNAGLTHNYLSIKSLSPIEILKFFQACNSGCGFSGIHMKPFFISNRIVHQMEKLQHIYEGYIYYVNNKHIFLHALNSETLDTLNNCHDSSPTQLEYRGLALAYAWQEILKENLEINVHSRAVEMWENEYTSLTMKQLPELDHFWLTKNE